MSNYQTRDMAPAAQERQADLICELRHAAHGLDRKHAIALAAGILHDLLSDGIDGADIRNPAHVTQCVRAARNALNKAAY